MSLYFNKSSNFDIYTAELIFFYVDNYKLFKKQSFCFYPKYDYGIVIYDENDSSIVKLHTRERFVDLFEKEKINVEVICGKNGCGKSTLLNLIADVVNYGEDVKKFYIFKDGKGNFASSTNCLLFIDNKQIALDYTKPAYNYFLPNCCVNFDSIQIDDYEFEKNITKFYSDTPGLFDGVVDGKLFTNFKVEFWNFDSQIEFLMKGSRKSLFRQEDIYDLKNWLYNDLLSFLLLRSLQDNIYDNVAKTIEKNLYDLNVDLQSFLYNNVYTNYSPSIVDYFAKQQKKFLHKSFKLTDLSKVEELILKYENKFLDFMFSFSSVNKGAGTIDPTPSSYLYFQGYSTETRPHRYLSNLSNGEWNSLKYRYEIFNRINQSDGSWWYIDEPEKSLHPEWCRTFLSDYLKAYRDVKKYLVSIGKKNSVPSFNPDKRFTIIFATHSPFLLSDLTNDYIIYLEKSNGQTKQIQVQKEVFAGNIGEMYNANFFMQNTIGEFARTKIKEIVTRINNNEEVSVETLENWKLLTSKVGDDILRNLLTDKVLAYEKNRTK